jgi:DNA-binding HxlR family transcriptional regulator
MDGTWIDADLIDDGKFDCPDGTDEYTPFVEEVQNSEELSEEEIVEVDEDETEQDLDSTPTTLVGDDSEDSGISTTEANDGVQTETEEQASKDSYIVIGGLLSFFVLIAILLGTVAVSKKEDIMLSSVFNEGGVDINELLGLLGRSKMLKVMHVLNLHGEGIRFTELKATVDTSATTLSRRLGELEEFGLVSRTELPTVPMTVIYRLTDAGLSLMPRVEGMFEWALMNGQHDE